MKTTYINRYTSIGDNDIISINEDLLNIEVQNVTDKKIGVMIIGVGGNNGSTFTAGLLAYKKKLQWENKDGIHDVEFLGSLAEFGSVNICYKKNKPYTKLIKDMIQLIKPEDIVIGGWDICSDDLYTACKNNKVILYTFVIILYRY
jgi:myo-inositol-1-phosphate synthase